VTLNAGAQQTVTVTINRSNDTDAIAFTLTSATTGITGTYSAASTNADTTVLTLSIASTVAAGTSYSATVTGTDATVTPNVVVTKTLPITVLAPATTLLVDNDGYTPPNTDTDISLPIYEALLANAGDAGIPYQLFQEPSDGSGDTHPNSTDLAGINTMIFFTGDNYGSGYGTLSSAQQATFSAWLNGGGKTLILFVPAINYDWSNGWTGPETNTFLTLIGEVGGAWAPTDDVTDQTIVADAENSGLTVTGAAGTPFAGLQWQINGDVTSLKPDGEAINPATGVTVLATVQADPTGSGSNSAVAIIIGYKNMGTAGTSTVVLVDTSFENIFSPLTGYNSEIDMFNAILNFTGL
jgi:hypothetical protein